MFPTVRLLIGTLFIALLVLSCEFGVFAALRVNREPLSRLTSESAPLRLAAGNNAPRPVPISWNTSLNVPAPAIDAPASIAIVEVPAAQPAERAIETPAPSNDAAAGTLNNDTLNSDNQASPAAVQTALAPAPAAPLPLVPAAGDVAAPIAQAPVPPANMPAPVNAATPANPEASGAPAQEIAVPAVSSDAANGPPEQTAAPAAVAALPEQQTPAAEVAKPAEAEPPQAVPPPQPDETAVRAGEPPPAGGAPVIAAIAPGAAEPLAAQPAEITGSVPNAATPETATPQMTAPQAKAPHAKPLPKIVRKPAAKKPHKVAHAPAQPHHPVKKRIARRTRTPAAAQAANTFENPVFQSAPEFQRPTKSRARGKNTATNTGFSNTFGAQLSPQ